MSTPTINAPTNLTWHKSTIDGTFFAFAADGQKFVKFPAIKKVGGGEIPELVIAARVLSMREW